MEHEPGHVQDLNESFVRLLEQSGVLDIGLSVATVAGHLLDIGHKYLGADADSAELLRFYRTLQLKDLVLAQACAEGISSAWDVLVQTYKPKLQAAALAITRDRDSARELADSLFGELFDAARNGSRCKLLSFTGRGTLEGWLKANLAQAYIDRYRAERRLVSLDDHTGASRILFPQTLQTEGADPRLERAVAGALGDLAPSDRLLLAAYFFDGRTLAEIAAMLRIHESTASRRIRKVTKAVRKTVTRTLLELGMSRDVIQELIDSGAGHVSLDIERVLYQGFQPVRE